jgi:hypothetical protein
MKKSSIIFSLGIMIAFLAFMSCSTDEVIPDSEVSVHLMTSSDFISVDELVSFEDAKKLLIDFESSSGDVISKTLNLILENEKLTSTSKIILRPGDYVIKSAVVVNRNSTIIYAAPAPGSKLDQSNSFNISANGIESIDLKLNILPLYDPSADFTTLNPSDFGLEGWTNPVYEYKKFTATIREWSCPDDDYIISDTYLKLFNKNRKFLRNIEIKNDVFDFKLKTDESVIIVSENFGIDTTITSSNLEAILNNNQGRINDWYVNDESICGEKRVCLINDVKIFNQIDTTGTQTVIFTHEQYIYDNATKKSRVSLKNYFSKSIAVEVIFTETGNIWRTFNLAAGEEKWFTVETAGLYNVFDSRENVKLAELIITYDNPEIPEAERCE